MDSNRWQKRLLYSFFFLSGACGLIYEVLWARYLGLFLGNTTYAHAVVLSAFMGGLALGNALFGRIADRTRHYLTFYAWLEVGIGFYAVFTPALFLLVKSLFLSMGDGVAIGSFSLQMVKIALAFPVILLPAFLMGGTLPFLAKVFVIETGNPRREISLLYGLNSIGAVLGALITAFYLVPSFGLDFSIFLAAAVNVLIGIGVIAIRSRSFSGRVSVQKRDSGELVPRSGPVTPSQLRLAVWAVGLSGFTSMLYELAWFRFFALVLGSSIYSFALMLAAFISGIALGSFWLARPSWNERTIHPYRLFALCEIGIAVSIALSLPLYARLPYVFNQLAGLVVRHPLTFPLFEAMKYLFCFVIMLIPTVFFGMTLPLVSRLSLRQWGTLGRSIGNVFAVNTVGAVIGSLAAGFLLIPAIGLKGTFMAASAVNAAIGWMILASPRAAVPLVFVLMAGILTPPWSRVVLNSGLFRGTRIFENFRQFLGSFDHEVIYYKDGSQTTVAVTRSGQGELRLLVNGKPDASSKGDLKTEILLGQVPMLLHRQPRQVLNIGIGSGITCGTVLTHPVQRLDVVEISREVIEACRFFKEHNHAFFDDTRTHIYQEDAKTYLQLTSQTYDVIISEPSNPWMSGIGGLFTKEFFNEVKGHLNPGGIFVQWFHAYEMSDETAMMILRTFASVFPVVNIWQSQGLDIMMIGSVEPLPVDLGILKERILSPEITGELGRIQIADLPTFLIHQMVSSGGVSKMIWPGSVNSDYFPYLEYDAPKDFFYGQWAEILFRYDEKHRSASNGNLLLGEYLKGNELKEEDLRRLYEVIDPYSRTTHSYLISSMAELWRERFASGDDPALTKIAAEFNSADLLTKISAYKKLMEQNSGRLEYLSNYLSYFMSYYLRNNSILRPIDMKGWLAYCNEAIESSPDEKERFYWMKSGVLYREGDIAGCLESLQKGLVYLEQKGGKEKAKEEFLRMMVRVYMEEGLREEAVEILGRLGDLNPENTVPEKLIEFFKTAG